MKTLTVATGYVSAVHVAYYIHIYIQHHELNAEQDTTVKVRVMTLQYWDKLSTIYRQKSQQEVAPISLAPVT